MSDAGLVVVFLFFVVMMIGAWRRWRSVQNMPENTPEEREAKRRALHGND